MTFEFGKCPECGSYNVDFGDIYWDDDMIYPRIQQECTCGDCGCEYLEKHNTTYACTDVEKHGTEYKEAEEEL